MAGSHPAHAEDDFYSGKTIQVLIGFSSGGGYDLYGRTLARYLGRHIPGNPQVLPHSLKLVNYLYNVAPKDGTAIGIFAPGILAEPLLGHGDGTQFDATKFGWLGSVSQEVSVCAFMASTGIASLKDMQAKPSVIGASGGGAESDVFATVLRNMFKMPIRIVTGYPGGTEITLAMQRHEVDGRCGWSWTSLLSRNKAMLTGNEINLTLQVALNKDDDPYLLRADHGFDHRSGTARGAQAHRIAAEHRAAIRNAARRAAGAACGAALSLRRHDEGCGFSRRSPHRRSRRTAGIGRRSRSADQRNLRIAARGDQARHRGNAGEAVNFKILQDCANESLAVAREFVLPSASRPRKNKDASCESGLISVAYESTEGKFIRP
jgi:hypothetical protein